ncbi:MAG: YqcC family protein [Marinobacter sp.]|uniref:YqcC family protein n=1 Tax=Marinobacter sp. TaxID=50741 RepID=UPI00299D9B17|nr:YqcC family protein [Marinobacter sp.]MDX1757460.1 YqcC family protein [Marinobacter sp.]
MSANDQEKLDQVTDSLLQIELELRRLDAWSATPPAPEALQSNQPFAVDTLEFTEWLQFIFIRRMKTLVEKGAPLPSVSGMAPMAEEHFRGRDESGQRLIRELEVMDQLLSG